MTNDIFSPSRFALYVKQYAGENKKKLIQMVLTIIGTMIFVAAIFPILNGCYYFPSHYNPTQYLDPMWEKETTVFWIFLFTFACVAAAGAFISYDTKIKRISALTFPASNLEKYLTYILFYGIAIYATFFVGLIVADYIRVWTAPIYATEGAMIEPLPLKYFFSFGHLIGDERDAMSYYDAESVKAMRMFTFTGLITLQSFFFLAASIWPKNARLRGILSLIGITIAMNFITYLAMKIFINIHGISFTFRFENEMRDLGFETFTTIVYTIGIIVTIGFYLLSYKRFKEMESIERW